MNFEYILILLIVPAYVIWRYSVALRARERVAHKLDKYLGESSPEPLKYLLTCLFEDAMKPTIILQVFFFSFWSKRKHIGPSNAKSVSRLISGLDKDEQKKFRDLLFGVISINVRLAPLTYFIIGLITLIFITIEVVMNISTHGIKALLNSKVESAESVYLRRG